MNVTYRPASNLEAVHLLESLLCVQLFPVLDKAVSLGLLRDVIEVEIDRVDGPEGLEDLSDVMLA